MVRLFLEKLLFKTGCIRASMFLKEDILKEKGNPNYLAPVLFITREREYEKLQRISLKAKHTGEILENGSPVLINHLTPDNQNQWLVTKQSYKNNISLLILPLQGEGLLYLIAGKEGYFNNTTKEMLFSLMPQLQRAIHSCLAYEKLQRLLKKEEIQKKKALKVTSYKNRLFATISHEMRTPLNIIINFTEQLMENFQVKKSISEEDLVLLNKLLKNGNHLKELINNFLDISKMEAGKMNPEFTTCNLRELINSSIEDARYWAGKKRLPIEIQISPDLKNIVADPSMIRQVLYNLFINSVKYSDRGRILIQVNRKNNEMLFTVKDNGPGISPDLIGHIFEPFTRADNSSTSSTGTGLGLAVTKRFIELHKGRVWVENLQPNGAAFFFTLPERQDDTNAREKNSFNR